VRVQRRLDCVVHGEYRRRDLGDQALALEQPDDVLPGDRAAEPEGGGDDLVERQLGAVAGGLVAGRGDQERVQVPSPA
jgi:hypothetical protein